LTPKTVVLYILGAQRGRLAHDASDLAHGGAKKGHFMTFLSPKSGSYTRLYPSKVPNFLGEGGVGRNPKIWVFGHFGHFW